MRIVSYYRVSTAKQGQSGLGLDAQRAQIEAFCAAEGCETKGEFVEVESGKQDNRPELAKALHQAKVTGSTLVIAKLDRLSRNAAFVLTLKESGVSFVAADMPNANNLTIGIMALVAQQEREAISDRTKQALAAAKAKAAANGRGVKADGTPWKNGAKLGNPLGAAAFGGKRGNPAAIIKAKAAAFAKDRMPIIEAIRAEGRTSLRAIAAELNARGIVTARGGKWGPQSVSDVIRAAQQENEQ
jgi:DNA invertase Pin-like site-specific DNA recombinase